MGYGDGAVNGSFILLLDGKVVGRLAAVEGGNMVAQVVTGGGSGNVTSKHIGAVSIQDLKLKAGPGMAKEFYEWLGNTLQFTTLYKNGSVVMLDIQQKPVREISFQHGLIDEIIFPAVDVANSSKVWLSVSIAPELARHNASSPSLSLGQYAATVGLIWTANNFRFSIAGLEKECSHVTKIDEVKFSQKIQEDMIGTSRISQKVPGGGSFSNLKIVIPAMHAQGFLDWHEDMVVKGNGSEKNGTLEYIGKSDTYFTLEYTNLGIISYSMASAFAENTNAPVTIEMYFESMKLKAGGAAIK